ncbi:hypothetical protein LB504_007013 [Fusarium proliferatum]|nr:hypothetical protein LB504_007013 [Fusarium proliferatum]
MLCTHYRSAPPVPVRYSEVAYSVRRGYFYPIILDPVLIPVQVQSDLVVQGCLFLFLRLIYAAVGRRNRQVPVHKHHIIHSSPSIPTIPCLAYFSPTSKNSPQLPPLTSHIFSLLSSPLLLLNNRHTPPSFSVSLSVLHCFGQTRRATPTRDTILVLHTLELFGTRHPSSQVPTSRPVIPYLLQSSLAGLAPVLESSYNRIPCDLLFRLHLSSQITLFTSQ